MDEMTMYYTHYIKVDEEGRIQDGWSDGPHYDRDTTGATLLTDQGSYQFRLWADGEENPTLWTFPEKIPLYKWNGETVARRTEEEIEAEIAAAMLPTAEVIRAQRDDLLAKTDWTQVLDAPINTESREAYRAYRQALRDIPAQEGFPTDVVWPAIPEAVKATPDPVDTAVAVLVGGEE